MRTLVLGDCHGGYKALMQCLKDCYFDYEKDNLIFLGDVADGWSQTPQCVEEFMKMKNLIMIMGNHDKWLIDWLTTGATPLIWTEQGGRATIKAYRYEMANPDSRISLQKHLDFLNKAHYYYIDDQNRIFTHGGFNKHKPVREQHKDEFLWDRVLAEEVITKAGEGVKEFKEVYLGHTSVWQFSEGPMAFENVICMDTGAGWEGKLSIMDIDTKEVWQSDIVSQLYPVEGGRYGRKDIWDKLYGKL